MEKSCSECIHFPVCVIRVDIDDVLSEVVSKYATLAHTTYQDREEIRDTTYSSIAKFCNKYKK